VPISGAWRVMVPPFPLSFSRDNRGPPRLAPGCADRAPQRVAGSSLGTATPPAVALAAQGRALVGGEEMLVATPQSGGHGCAGTAPRRKGAKSWEWVGE
jgi:hypothetical protein